jgi:hypothetical protein
MEPLNGFECRQTASSVAKGRNKRVLPPAEGRRSPDNFPNQIKQATAPSLRPGWRRSTSNVSLLKKSGTGIERQSDAERLLPGGALGSSQSLGDFRRSGFLFRQRL